MFMEPRTQEELDSEPVVVWTDSNASLFNDATSRPTEFGGLAGGVAIADISGIHSGRATCICHGGVLKRNFGEFGSLCGTSLSRFQAYGQGDSEGFVYLASRKNYIMYAF